MKKSAGSDRTNEVDRSLNGSAYSQVTPDVQRLQSTIDALYVQSERVAQSNYRYAAVPIHLVTPNCIQNLALLVRHTCAQLIHTNDHDQSFFNRYVNKQRVLTEKSSSNASVFEERDNSLDNNETH